MPGSFRKFFNLLSNIRNWHLYTFQKEKRHRQPLEFITKPNALRVEVDSANYAVFKEIFIEDFYHIDSILENAGNSPLVIDIGANRGMFCAMLLSKKPGSRILAYEPLPKNTAHFRKFKDLNNGKTKNLELFEMAVTGSPEKSIKIFAGGDEGGSIASIYKEFDDRNHEEIEVRATTLGEIYLGLNDTVIDILKVDCEGAEYPILYNTSKETLHRARTMLIEVHELDDDRRNVKSLCSFLEANDFVVSTEKFRNDCYLMTAIRKSH
jgi:FkbM family methyltransferase